MQRRRGSGDTASRTALMDAVESIMLNDGYAALSVRKVAHAAGLNYQLVFYYFGTIEELFLATYRRRTERLHEKLEAALGEDRPLHAIWNVTSDPDEAALSLEYIAMSNHTPSLRGESIHYADRMLALVSAKMEDRLRAGLPDPNIFTPSGVSMIIAMMGNSIGFQVAQGIGGGGLQETKALMEWWLNWLEPAQGAGEAG